MTRNAATVGCAGVLLLGVIALFTYVLPESAERQREGCTVAVYAEYQDLRHLEAFSAKCQERGIRVTLTTDNARTWLESDADVLVIFSPTGEDAFRPSRPPHRWSPQEISVLGHRRVLVIGVAAGEVLDELGLAIGASMAAEFQSSHPLVVPGTAADRLSDGAFAPYRSETAGRLGGYQRGVWFPKWSRLSPYLDAVLRWQEEPDYCALVRQGCFAWCLPEATCALWTDQLHAAVGSTILQVSRASFGELFRLPWKNDMLGERRVELAPFDSGRKCLVWYHHRFEAAGILFVEVESDVTSGLVAQFWFDEVSGPIWATTSGGSKRLQILLPATQRFVEKYRGRPWRLELSNKRRESAAKCHVRVRFETSGTVELASKVSVRNILSGARPGLMSELAQALGHSDRGVFANACGVLLSFGPSAKAAVEDALVDEEAMDEWRRDQLESLLYALKRL